jgi:hypothetical protein
VVNNQPSNVTLLSFVSASILGLISLVLFVLSSSVSLDSFTLRKPLIGSIFSLICILGALAVILPSKCNSILGGQKKGSYFGSHSAAPSSRVLKGHHFDCEGYVPHTVKLGGRTLCAACSGLFLGAIVAVFGSVAYFFSSAGVGQFSLLFLIAGMGLVALGFIQFKFPRLARLLVNALFVLGAFLVLLAVDTLLMNLFIDLYVISLTMLWILTRILLSQWDHSRICRSCTVDCELKKG